MNPTSLRAGPAPASTLAFATAFAAGLATLGWIAAGYVGNHPLALAVTGLITAFYAVGALELRRFRQATGTLNAAVAPLTSPPERLDAWLAGLHPGLQPAVRQRIEGGRNALPGPALTPFLAGLLVLLGMLGTFLGMVATLKGTGSALDGAGDLQALRAALSEPVKGLGLAFGTSVAGIAASAALGLMSALARRERLQAAQALDAAIAGHLRAFSPAHQRDAAFVLLQRQADAMPVLADRLQAMMAALETQNRQLAERLQAQQDGFHDRTEAAYSALAASVGQSLQATLADSARAAGATLQPVVEATLAGIARETAALHGQLAATAQQQIDQLAKRLDVGAQASTAHWQAALGEQQRSNEALAQGLRTALDQFGQTFETRSAALVDGVAARLDGTASHLATHWQQALEQHERSGDLLANRTRQALEAASASIAEQAAGLSQGAARAHAQLQAELAARDEQRLASWTTALQAMATDLKAEWRQAGEDTLRQQQQVCQTLAQTAQAMGAQAEAHARQTIAEIGRLVQAAAEAPRVAAEVVAELRQKLSDSMARDNTMLEERSRILDTLATLLDAVNHAASQQRSAVTEQRAAIDALVATSAGLLERVGARFAEQVDAEAGRLATVSAQLTGSAVEVASLGEAFGLGVELFGQSNDKLVVQLQRIEDALAQSLSRSDEQLAYYVAQAREVIDLSILSQQQIVDNLQQLAGREALSVTSA